MQMLYAIAFGNRTRTGRYSPAQEADAYGALLNTAEDAIGWTGERGEKAA